MIQSLWKFFTSLRLTVTCLAFGLAVVFAGSLAQVNEGLLNAQNRWFRSWFVWWGPTGAHWHLPVFTGGYLVGSVLLANLIAAHAKRFTWSPRKIGIQLTHLGVILLLVGQLVTDMLSQERLMSFKEGETKVYSEAGNATELVFASDAAGGQEKVVSIPGQKLKPGAEISAPELPFTLKVQKFEPNSQVVSRTAVVEAAGKLGTALATVEGEFSAPEGLLAQAERAQGTPGREEVWRKALTAVGEKDVIDVVEAARRVQADRPRAERLCVELKTRFRTEMLGRFQQNGGAMRLAAGHLERHEPVTAETLPAASANGDGREAVAVPQAEATDMDSRNLPYAIVELLESGKSLGTWIMTPWLDPQVISVAGQTYRAALRFERTYHPFSTTLLKTTHDVYRGTDIPKNYQSRVRINNPASGETREVDIYMNNPLRYAGLTFYQFQMGPGEGKEGSSTLQVIRNPAWVTPYLGCILVALGMLYQFLYHLVSFLAKRRAPVPTLAGGGVRTRQTRAAAPALSKSSRL